MKRISITSRIKIKLLFTALLLVLSACKKGRNPDNEPNDGAGEKPEVIINGKKYGTVKIGSRTWTTVNYAGDGGITYTGTPARPEYGKYYTFAEVEALPLPQGWRVPTESDFRALLDHYGITFENNVVVNPEPIKKLTSKTNWKNIQGNNESGFNAFPGGYSVDGSQPLDGDLSELWMADGKTFCIMEGGNLTSYRIVFFVDSNRPENRFNLRLVKDND